MLRLHVTGDRLQDKSRGSKVEAQLLPLRRQIMVEVEITYDYG